MHSSKNWDDVRYVLAVAREGTLSSAAKMLGVTHATVMRRIAAFEAAHGQPVFLRAASGYTVLPTAEPILRAARNVEDAIYSIERAIEGSNQSLTGVVRIASTDSLCQEVLPQVVQVISAAFPDLSLSLLSANTHHDLSRLTADIAIRPTVKLEDGLIGKVAGRFAFGQYSKEIGSASWIGLEGPLKRSRAADWMRANVPQDRILHHTDSFLVARELVAAGYGNALLPDFVGDGDVRLQRHNTDLRGLEVPVWIATQEDMARNVRFGIVREALHRELAKVLNQTDVTTSTAS